MRTPRLSDQQDAVNLGCQHRGIGDRQHRGYIEQYDVSRALQPLDEAAHALRAQQLRRVGREGAAGQQPQVLDPRVL